MRSSLILAAACTLAVPLSVQARETASIHVTYSDLDLATPEGQQRLERRVEAAVKKVCGVNELPAARTLDPEVGSCMREARAKAATDVAYLVEREAKGG